MEKINHISWITAVKRKHTPLFVDFLLKGQTREKIKQNTNYDFCFKNILKSGMTLAYDSLEIKKNRSNIREKINSEGIKVFNEFEKKCLNSCHNLLVFSTQLANKNYSDSNRKELLHDFQLYCDYAINHASFLQTMILTQFELEQSFHNIISERLKLNSFPKELIESYKSKLSVTAKKTHEIKNAIDLIGIAIQIQNDPSLKNWVSLNPNEQLVLLPLDYPDLWKKISEYKEKYGWMGKAYYDGNLTSELDIILRLNNLLEFDCKKKLKEINQRQEKRSGVKLEIVKKLGNDNELNEIVDIIGRYRYLRTFRLDVFFIAHERILHLLKIICKNINVNYSEFLYLTSEEIIYLLSQENINSLGLKKTAKNRRNFFSIFTDSRNTFWIDKEILNPSLENDSNEISNVLKGNIANEGFVTGNTYIILDKDDMDGMVKNNILVTPMTMPNLMLAVEKSSAIVTDEGGILCHAAIISRELDIPCIIGTNNATDFFSNGDFVEVNANKGFIKKIN